MSKRDSKNITKEQTMQLLNLPNWQINPISPENWHLLPGFINTACTEYVVASGNAYSDLSTTMHNISNVIGGFDWIKNEFKPKKNETLYNCYHFVITKNIDGEFLFYGPFTNGMSIPHWANEADIIEYKTKLFI